MRVGTAIRWVAAAVAGLVPAAPAHGFYFRGWPAGPTQPPSLLLPKPKTTSPPHAETPFDGGEPPGTPNGPPGVGPGPVPGGGPGPGGGPPGVAAPEPAAGVLAAVGLGLVAARRARRRAGR
jgi:hypothetical protein